MSDADNSDNSSRQNSARSQNQRTTLPQPENAQRDGRANENRTNNEAKNWWPKWTAIATTFATIFIMIATIVNVCVAIKQWKALESQVGEMTDAYNLADNTAKLQSQPRILPDQGQVVLKDRDFVATFVLKNIGQTPAYSVRSWAAVRVDDADVGMTDTVARFKRQRVENQVSSTDLGRDMPYTIRKSGAILSSEVEAIQQHHKAIWMWGRIHFEDNFPRTTYSRCFIEEFFARADFVAPPVTSWPFVVVRNDISPCEGMGLDRKATYEDDERYQ